MVVQPEMPDDTGGKVFFDEDVLLRDIGRDHFVACHFAEKLSLAGIDTLEQAPAQS